MRRDRPHLRSDQFGNQFVECFEKVGPLSEERLTEHLTIFKVGHEIAGWSLKIPAGMEMVELKMTKKASPSSSPRAGRAIASKR